MVRLCVRAQRMWCHAMEGSGKTSELARVCMTVARVRTTAHSTISKYDSDGSNFHMVRIILTTSPHGATFHFFTRVIKYNIFLYINIYSLNYLTKDTVILVSQVCRKLRTKHMTSK